jgi:hypothetical protein
MRYLSLCVSINVSMCPDFPFFHFPPFLSFFTFFFLFFLLFLFPLASMALAQMNGTAVAVPRLIVALLETGQRADGSVRLPACLAPFLGAATHITPQGRLAK